MYCLIVQSLIAQLMEVSLYIYGVIVIIYRVLRAYLWSYMAFLWSYESRFTFRPINAIKLEVEILHLKTVPFRHHKI